MIEYGLIFVIVGWAFWFTGRTLWREVKSGQCANCYVSGKEGCPVDISHLLSGHRNHDKS